MGIVGGQSHGMKEEAWRGELEISGNILITEAARELTGRGKAEEARKVGFMPVDSGILSGRDY